MHKNTALYIHRPLYLVLKEASQETAGSAQRPLKMGRVIRDVMIHMILQKPNDLADLLAKRYGYPPEYARSLVEKMKRRYIELVTS